MGVKSEGPNGHGRIWRLNADDTWRPVITSAPNGPAAGSDELSRTTAPLASTADHLGRIKAEDRPLKVLLLSLYHPAVVPGGAQQVCYDLFCALEAMDGVEPTLLAAIDPTLSQFYKTGATITGFNESERQFLYLSQTYDYKWHKTSDARSIEGLSEFFRIINPDIVHIHHFFLFGIDVISLVRKTIPTARIVFTFHEFMSICHADGHLLRRQDGSNCSGPGIVQCNQCFPDLPQSYFFMREGWFKAHLKKVDRFTVPSKFMIEHFVAFGLEQESISLIPNGSLAAMESTGASASNSTITVFGFFGQLVDAKGVGLLLEAAKILQNEGFNDFRIEINGDNLRFASEALQERVAEVRRLETEVPLGAAAVVFNGAYTHAELSRRMDAVDWCIIPSLWPEAFCLVLSEAWAHQRPPIVADLGALSERVNHNVDGLLFSPGNARSLARAMYAASTTPGLKESLANAAPPQMTVQTSARLYLEAYKAEPSPGPTERSTLRGWSNAP